MSDKARTLARSYGPSTVYIHEKKEPFPYYAPPPHCCELIRIDDQRKNLMMPQNFVLVTVVVSVMVFVVLSISLMVAIDVRARLTTPVVRARLQNSQNRLNFASVVEGLMKALDVYNQLNNS